jgi:hypothetical protein
MNSSRQNKEVLPTGVEGRELRANGGCKEGEEYAAYPPLSCRTSPPQVGRSAWGHGRHSIRNTSLLQDSRDRQKLTTSRSPPLRGRCPAGQRGVSPTQFGFDRATISPQNLSPKNTSQPNQSLTQIPHKTSKYPPASFSTPRESPAQLSRSALGYTARRCGEAGPALGSKG